MGESYDPMIVRSRGAGLGISDLSLQSFVLGPHWDLVLGEWTPGKLTSADGLGVVWCNAYRYSAVQLRAGGRNG